jgi:hypothetical protein
MRKAVIPLLLLFLGLQLPAQQALNNDAVIKLTKAGLSDDLIVSTINAQAGTYDTSADGLIALKVAGVSDRVVTAMVSKEAAAQAGAPAPPADAPIPPLQPMPESTPVNAAPSAPAQPMPAATATYAAPGLPPGIDEVGVYYQDRSGAWAEVTSEIVNFKTGGVLKTMATDGLVKGDMNGHIQGAHGKTTATFPVLIAVYVPEGTSITEYQLLRLRTHNNSREFRSVTGGIIHSSGGATRDAVDFAHQKIAPRLYQITLDSSLGRGEYGLLPPGAIGSANMASSGKIYSFSITE